jgi:exodeoxyribonuclease VII large subunit
VARAIVEAPVPVISAVGHEIDTTIADLAADVRAATPSQAAELVVRQAAEFSTRLDTATRQLALGLQQRLERRRVLLLRLQQRPAFAHLRDGVVARDRARHERAIDLIAAMRGGQARRARILEDLAGRLAYQHPRTQLTARLRRMVAIDSRLLQAGGAVATTRSRQLAETGRRLALCGPGADLATHRRTLDLAHGRLHAAISTTRHRADGMTRALAGRLENLSPLRTLARGYAACWDATHSRLLRSTDGVAPGTAVHVQLADGELHCRVEHTTSSRTDTP